MVSGSDFPLNQSIESSMFSGIGCFIDRGFRPLGARATRGECGEFAGTNPSQVPWIPWIPGTQKLFQVP